MVTPSLPDIAYDPFRAAPLWREALGSALRLIDGLHVRYDVALSELGRWKIGGPADLVVEANHEQALGNALRLVSESNAPFMVIGDGSNLLFDDEGFRGVVIRITRRMAELRISGDVVTAQAGIWVPVFARRIGCGGLSGAEHTIGIPGTLGGLIVMNGGSQRKGIGSHLVEAVCLDMEGNRHILSQADCHFAYRKSALQRLSLIVVEATFQFLRGDRTKIRHEMISIMAERRRKFPIKLPNCGSVFLSDPAMYDTVGPPGKAIEEAGLRGRRIGDAQIAPAHGNFIVNLGNARSQDVLALIQLIRHTVHARTNFWMNCEVRHVYPDGRIVPAHEQRDHKEEI